VDPVPDPLLLGKSGGPGNRTRDLRIYGQEVLSTRSERQSILLLVLILLLVVVVLLLLLLVVVVVVVVVVL
jgi:hypothetical protein